MAGLDAWYALPESQQRNILWFGDSTVAGHLTDITNMWPYKVASDARWNSRGFGVRSLWLTVDEWTPAGTWTEATTSDAWDVMPFPAGVQYANGATATQTWVLAPGMTEPTSFQILYVDTPGEQFWSYSLDGPGGPWSVVGGERLGDDVLKGFIVEAPITALNGLILRAANTGGTGVECHCAGIVIYDDFDAQYNSHNLGKGGDFLGSLTRTTAGDPYQVLDIVEADIVVTQFTNDVVLNADPTNYGLALNDLANGAAAHGGETIHCVFPTQGGVRVEPPDYSAEMIAYQNEIRTRVIELSTATLDFQQAWVDVATANARGFFKADEVHFTDLGNADLAHRMWDLIASDGTGPRMGVR